MKIKYISLFFLAASIFVSCEDDDLDGMDPSSKPVATTSVRSLDLVEGQSAVIPFTISQAINKVSQFKILVLSGDAEQDLDFTAGNPMDPDTGIPGQGFEVTVPAYATSFEIPIETIRDLDQTEGTETVTLQISAAGVRTVITPNSYYEVEVTIRDFEYCMWTLDVVDDYGDSWQGAHVIITQDGISELYPKADWDDDAETYEIPVGVGADFEFVYESGTTGMNPNAPGAPGYEEENSFVLTSPNGTVYTGGVSPADGTTTPDVGTIVAGINNCN